MGFSQIFFCNYDFFAFLNSLEGGLIDIFENQHEILDFFIFYIHDLFQEKTVSLLK
jgi:hypothetical protein